MHLIYKWLLSFGLLALFANMCFGQAKSDTTALQNAIKNHPQQDTVRINLLNKAGFLLYRNRAKVAYGYYSESFYLAKKINYDKGEAASALGLGFYHRFRGEHAKALIYSKRAEQLYIKLHDTLNQIACQYNLINIYRLQNDLLKSITVNLDALKLAQAVHSDKWLILLNNLIGQTFLRMGDLDKGSNYINTALNVALKKNDLDGMQHCYNGLGDICQQKEQWQKAKAYYENSALITIKTNNMQSYNETMLSIGQTKIKLGDYDSVLIIAYRALKNIKKIQDYGDVPFAHSVLASAYLGLGHADSAVKYGLLSLQARQVRGEKFSISSASEVLAKAYVKLGNYKEAYRYHVLFTNYRDSVNQNQNLHRLDVIQFTYDLDKKQSQITLLKNNAELISRESRQQKILLIFMIGGLIATAVFSFVLFKNNRQKQLANKLLSEQNERIEAQAKEAQIESALEKVRSCALGMRQRADMLDICRMISEQLELLNISEIRNVQTAIIYTEKGIYINYEYYRLYNKTFITEVDYSHPIQADFVKKMLEEGGSQTLSLEGDELKDWFGYQKKTNQFPDPYLAEASSLNYYWFSIGPVALGISLYAPLNEDGINLFKRFLDVFRLAYRRYADIELAEAQAKEAQIEAALEKVRSRSMGMQKSDELKDVIRVVYDQLVHLNVNVEHAGFIMEYKDRGDMHIWLADKHEIPSELTIPYFDSPHWNSFIDAKEKGIDFFANYLAFEEKNKFYHDLFKLFPVPDDAKDYYFNCTGLAISTVLLDSVGLYIENFSGIPYLDEENKMLMRFGKVFEQTYTRFLDLQKAEANALQAELNLIEITDSRKKAQDALIELKATQTQLIQSEKMASLGELTAGIAHEIQNPLNFVNNFSEVSVELLSELKEEAQAGNKEDVIAIADDLTQNLQKINHHGKRADAIVKGMLEHSRASTGQKEPTDLNALTDEYLRLAYHGLRSKDKTFNADLVTNYDANLPKVNAIPQDIGRVLINLFNNAFYAVNQKKKTAEDNYKPMVIVTTFTPPLANGGWGVTVKDNGNGIPDAIKDKIMQPFFTTKPTGEGTGLGLSLSYDIVVKGHGGSIDIETVPGEYSIFIIKLPLH